ncbi:MAG: hypothetical protein GOU99_03170 [Candidatus Altiarchaeota archaeon]|nr:hypothetical protein [Candidatus Altiarchaeota archaeon]
MTKQADTSETGCCPRFDPKPWNNKTIKFKNKLFVKDRVRSFFHIPLNFGAVVVKNLELIEAAGATNPDQIMLTDENSLWGADIYISVDKEVPGVETVRLSGTFMTQVFEGPYSNVGKWSKEIKDWVGSKNKQIKKMYFSYTTCPACAKVYGKNYVVIFAEI